MKGAAMFGYLVYVLLLASSIAFFVYNVRRYNQLRPFEITTCPAGSPSTCKTPKTSDLKSGDRPGFRDAAHTMEYDFNPMFTMHGADDTLDNINETMPRATFGPADFAMDKWLHNSGTDEAEDLYKFSTKPTDLYLWNKTGTDVKNVQIRRKHGTCALLPRAMYKMLTTHTAMSDDHTYRSEFANATMTSLGPVNPMLTDTWSKRARKACEADASSPRTKWFNYKVTSDAMTTLAAALETDGLYVNDTATASGTGFVDSYFNATTPTCSATFNSACANDAVRRHFDGSDEEKKNIKAAAERYLALVNATSGRYSQLYSHCSGMYDNIIAASEMTYDDDTECAVVTADPTPLVTTTTTTTVVTTSSTAAPTTSTTAARRARRSNTDCSTWERNWRMATRFAAFVVHGDAEVGDAATGLPAALGDAEPGRYGYNGKNTCDLGNTDADGNPTKRPQYNMYTKKCGSSRRAKFVNMCMMVNSRGCAMGSCGMSAALSAFAQSISLPADDLVTTPDAAQTDPFTPKKYWSAEEAKGNLTAEYDDKGVLYSFHGNDNNDDSMQHSHSQQAIANSYWRVRHSETAATWSMIVAIACLTVTALVLAVAAMCGWKHDEDSGSISHVLGFIAFVVVGTLLAATLANMILMANVPLRNVGSTVPTLSDALLADFHSRLQMLTNVLSRSAVALAVVSVLVVHVDHKDAAGIGMYVRRAFHVLVSLSFATLGTVFAVWYYQSASVAKDGYCSDGNVTAKVFVIVTATVGAVMSLAAMVMFGVAVGKGADGSGLKKMAVRTAFFAHFVIALAIVLVEISESPDADRDRKGCGFMPDEWRVDGSMVNDDTISVFAKMAFATTIVTLVGMAYMCMVAVISAVEAEGVGKKVMAFFSGASQPLVRALDLDGESGDEFWETFAVMGRRVNL